MMTSTPGLQGNHTDGCTVCLQGTDSAIAFEGDAEFAIAGLIRLGVPESEAGETLSVATGCDPGMAPVGRFTAILRVCGTCAERAGFPKPGVVALGELPCFSQDASDA